VHHVQRHAHLVDHLVRGVQAREDLRRDRDGDIDRDALLHLAGLVEQPVERCAVHELLDEQHLVLRGHDVEDRHHVAVVDLRCDARLVEEHRDELRVLGELGVQSLGRDDAREALVAHQTRDVDRRHAAPRDLSVQHVAADRRRLSETVCDLVVLVCAHGLRPHSKNWIALPELQK
jgi:hypothetical protein